MTKSSMSPPITYTEGKRDLKVGFSHLTERRNTRINDSSVNRERDDQNCSWRLIVYLRSNKTLGIFFLKFFTSVSGQSIRLKQSWSQRAELSWGFRRPPTLLYIKRPLHKRPQKLSPTSRATLHALCAVWHSLRLYMCISGAYTYGPYKHVARAL